MISRSRLLRFVTVSSPIVLVAVSLLFPVDSWFVSARGTLESALTMYTHSLIVMTRHTDASTPSETHPWLKDGEEILCPNRPWIDVKADSTAEPLDPDKAVVFQGTSAISLLEQSARPAPCNVRGTWTPTDSQIAQLEFDLAHYLTRGRAPTRIIPISKPPFERYYRRYGGLTLAGGERVIFVNAFSWQASTPAPVWKWKVDGESMFGLKTSYYVVEYDPEQRGFRGFASREHNDPIPMVLWARPRARRWEQNLDTVERNHTRKERRS